MVSVSSAIAQALSDSGASVGSYVPALGASGIFEEFCRINKVDIPLSFNEEVAYTISHGAALTGRRSFSIMKTHGVLKGANSIADSLFAGTTAGLVMVVVDDSTGIQSDSIIDAEEILNGLGIPFIVPEPGREYQDTMNSFLLSEKIGLPVAVVTDASCVGDDTEISGIRSLPPPPSYLRDIARHMLIPQFNDFQLETLAAKKDDRDWNELPRPDIPSIPDDVPDLWKESVMLMMPLFEEFASVRSDIVTGDVGFTTAFSFPPCSCIDITTYMGGSLPLAIGASEAGYDNVWAVTGDFSFIAAGNLALYEALMRDAKVRLLIIRNGIATSTGGQIIPDHALDRILAGYNEFVGVISDPGNSKECREQLASACDDEMIRIFIADYRDR